jgi:transcriptional regulator with XRE-family HTH domain
VTRKHTLKPPTTRRPTVRTGTVSELYRELKENGLPKAIDALRTQLNTLYKGAHGDNFALDDIDANVFRRGVSERTPSSSFLYEGFGPPPWFEAPYIVLSLEVRGSTGRFMTHAGEEILYNLPEKNSSFVYDFFWRDSVAPWHQPGQRKSDSERAVLEPGALIRINPTILHKNGIEIDDGEGNLKDKRVARSWLILRPLSLSAATFMFHLPGDAHPQSIEDGNKFTLEELMERDPAGPEQYKITDAQLIMLSSGILEKVRTHRQRADLTYAQFGEVLDQLNLSRNYIARLERRELENVSISNLFEIAKQLDVELLDLLQNLEWASKMVRPTAKLKLDSVQWVPTAGNGEHMMDAGLKRFKAGGTLPINTMKSIEGKILVDGAAVKEDPIHAHLISIVATQGQLLIDPLEFVQGIGYRPTGATIPVAQGHVFHARNFEPFRIEGRGQDSEALIILCRDRQMEGEPR